MHKLQGIPALPHVFALARTFYCGKRRSYEIAHQLGAQNIRPQDKVDMLQAEHRFTEALTFASYDEIVGMLDVVFREDYVGFPVFGAQSGVPTRLPVATWQFPNPPARRSRPLQIWSGLG